MAERSLAMGEGGDGRMMALIQPWWLPVFLGGVFLSVVWFVDRLARDDESEEDQ